MGFYSFTFGKEKSGAIEPVTAEMSVCAHFQILDGKLLADEICRDLAVRVEILKERGITPALRIVTSGSDDASKVYVRNKVRRAQEIGIDVTVEHYDELTKSKIRAECMKTYGSPIIFQLPTTPNDILHTDDVSLSMSEAFDVDGFLHTDNVTKLATGQVPAMYPCTPKGIMRLLQRYDIDVIGKTVCIIGRSNIVGRPLFHMMEQAGATVILCHSKTNKEQLYNAVDMADIVVSAVGQRNVINLDEFRKYMLGDAYDLYDKVFIDVGMNRDENGKLCGDIDPRLLEQCKAYTPVPGGVGPMTVAMLMENVVEYWEKNPYVF